MAYLRLLLAVVFVVIVVLVVKPAPAPKAGQIHPDHVYTNDTYGYSFKAPGDATVSAPQNYLAGPTASQQNTWIYFGNGVAVSINVFVDGKSTTYSQEGIANDPSFKRVDINGNDAWQSETSTSPDYQILTTVIFHGNYIYEIQYGGPTLGREDRAHVDAIATSFSFANKNASE